MSARRALTLAVAALALATPGLARPQELNVITAVELRDDGSTVVLSVKGSRPPNFTTFSMADPPRFVIDLSESRFEGVPEDLVVQDGVVNVVKNLSYGSDATSIARVMIAFQVEVEPPDVQTAGNTLVVRVVKPAAGGVAAAPPAAAEPAAAQPDPAAAEAARVEAERLAAAQAEAERQAGAQVAADAQARATAEAAAAAKLEEDRRAQAEQAQAELQARAQAEAQAQAEAATKQQADEEARQRYEAEQRAAAEQRAREEAAQARAADESRQAAAAEPSPTEAPLAAAPPPPPAPEPSMPSSAERLDAGAPRARLREIGFKELPGASRVYVRTTVTPRFTIEEAGENTIRVELENTRATRRNDTRFMDTSFFPGAVALVTPTKRGSSYVVEIKLKQRVPFQQKIEGDMLAIDFERPAAPAPTPDAAPLEDPPAEGAPAGAPPAN